MKGVYASVCVGVGGGGTNVRTNANVYVYVIDGCHMWGRKCSLLPEHLISLPSGEFIISPIHYTCICIIEIVSLLTMLTV